MRNKKIKAWIITNRKKEIIFPQFWLDKKEAKRRKKELYYYPRRFCLNRVEIKLLSPNKK